MTDDTTIFDHPATQLAPVPETDPSIRSILVIDDDPDQVEVLCYRLRKQGYKTLSAATGAAGLQLAVGQAPDLILLDLRLPDMNGLTVCQQLSDNPQTAALPVIVLSGMERPDIIRSTRFAGSQYYVRKPYDPNVLLVLIQNALRSAGEW